MKKIIFVFFLSFIFFNSYGKNTFVELVSNEDIIQQSFLKNNDKNINFSINEINILKEKFINQRIDEYKKKLPLKIDSSSTISNIEYKNNLITYTVEINNQNLSQIFLKLPDIQREEFSNTFSKNMKNEMLKNICQSSFKLFLDLDLKIEYKLFIKEKDYISQFQINKNDC